MSEFKTFSDAARLYAQNSAVVELMYERMATEIGAFLEAVAKAVQDRVGADVETKVTKSGYWYCWVVEPGVDADASFQIWTKARDPGLVQGRMEIGAGAPSANLETLQRLARTSHDPAVRDFCVPGNAKPWALLTATIRYGGNDPVMEAADQLSKLFLAALEAKADRGTPSRA